MKRKIISILLAVFFMASLVASVSFAENSPQASAGGAPSQVSYQGQVTIGGNPFNGPGYFKFAIIDPPGVNSYWSNDDTSSGGSQPVHALTLPVTNGLFNVFLGDVGMGMPPLTPSVFIDPARSLRVWFSSDGSTFTQLAPDTPIASVPYALQAADSNSLGGIPASFYQRTTHYLGRHWGARLDSTGDVGDGSSIAIGADGLGLISYYDYTQGNLKVLHCGNLFCDDDNTITAVDTIGNVGGNPSIAIGADGLGLISYWDRTNYDLKILHCGDLSCQTGNIATSVDTAGDVGSLSSITIGVDGLGLISYYDYTNGDLKVLHCGDLLCQTGNTTTSVDTNGDVGAPNSITIGSDGLGLISYFDFTSGDHLKVLHCGNLLCNSGNTATTADATNGVGGYAVVAIGADGLGLIGYYDYFNGDLKTLHCGDLLCQTGNTSTSVDTNDTVGDYTAITVGADGLGLISYFDETNGDLKLLHCGNTVCNDGNAIAALDTAGVVGLTSAITIGIDGQALISYYDFTNGDLKVIKMSGLGRR